MPEDVPNTDDMVIQKSHPRAKDCLIISLVPVVLIGCVEGIYLLGDAYFFGDGKVLGLLWLFSLLAQPFGIILGIFSLVQIRKNPSYCGTVYAVSGILITIFSFIFFLWYFR